jgi:hypothetical protein
VSLGAQSRERGARRVLSPRELSIFACLTDTVVAPEPVLPPVRDTDAAEFFDTWMRRAPRRNRAALRALLYLIELAPLAHGFRARMRRLPAAERARYLEAVEHSRVAVLRQLAKLVKGIAFLAYYGDDGVMLRLGYDAEANVRRGRELRAREGRP